jgi:hypothetical protein
MYDIFEWGFRKLRAGGNMSTSSKGQMTVRQIWAISIITSLIASAIFLIFFEPLLKWSASVFTGSASSVVRLLVDGAYLEAVAASQAGAIFKIMVMVATPYLILSIAISGATVAIIKRINNLVKDGGTKDDEDDSETQPIKSDFIFTHRNKIGWSLFAISLLVNVSWYTYTIASAYISIQAHSSFDRRMMALAPVVSDAERNQLYREWSFVASEADYEALMSRMETLAASKRQQLPKRFI